MALDGLIRRWNMRRMFYQGDDFMKETALDRFIRLCYDGFLQGWHERNGGNLSYRMKHDEVDQLKSILYSYGRKVDLQIDAKDLAGEYFIVTGSGRYMRNVPLEPEKNIGIIRINDEGDGYEIVWGLEDGAKPTSELPSHLMNHIARKSVTNGECRVIYHAHPANITALTYTIAPDAKTLSRILWQSETECAVVFPEGVGILDWMVPGSVEIAKATSELIKKYSAVVWCFHGIFGSGRDFDETFGLIHTIEKAAEIYLKAKSATITRTISDEELRVLAKAFGVELNKDFLD